MFILIIKNKKRTKGDGRKGVGGWGVIFWVTIQYHVWSTTALAFISLLKGNRTGKALQLLLIGTEHQIDTQQFFTPFLVLLVKTRRWNRKPREKKNDRECCHFCAQQSVLLTSQTQPIWQKHQIRHEATCLCPSHGKERWTRLRRQLKLEEKCN